MPCAAPSNWSMVFSPPKARRTYNFGNTNNKAKQEPLKKEGSKKPDSPKGKKEAPLDPVAAAKKEAEKAKEMAAKMEEKQEQAFCRWCAAHCSSRRAPPCSLPARIESRLGLGWIYC